MTPRSWRAPALARTTACLGGRLAARAEEFVTDLLGPPRFNTPTEWRYRARGSLAVKIKGVKRGLFFDHEAGTGGDFVELIRLTRGLTLAQALAHAEKWLGDAAPDLRAPNKQKLSWSAQADHPRLPSSNDGGPDNTAIALALWREAVPARGTLVERYLNARGLALPDDADDVRFHPRLLHSVVRRELPAMVALMRDIKTNAPTGIHRTYLSPDGTAKANVAPVKMMLGRARNACVKLGDDGAITNALTLSEGIETALAAHAIGFRNVWAALSAGGVKAFPVLGGIEVLALLADHDEAGEAAARSCAERWTRAGRDALVCLPAGAHKDWADVIKGLEE